jgi:hypothetical protein
MADVSGRSRSLPRPPFAFSLGVTGHRSEFLGGHAPAVAARLDDVIRRVTAAVVELRTANEAWFAAGPPQLTLVSPLADGADQVAAEIALAIGYEVQAVLPFARDTSRGAVAPSSRAGFDRLAELARCRLELPGDPDRPLDAYVMAGRATVAHCDLLVAVWDGEVPRGRGGTGEVVELAMARGTPVVHVPVDPAFPVTLLWSAYDPSVLTFHSGDIDRRPFDAAHLKALLELLLVPPVDERERRYLRIFFDEPVRRFRMRLEYPLLLAGAGISPLGPEDFRESRAAALRDEEWRRYREACAGRHGVGVSLDLLGDTHGWSDRLAIHFAQSYRSGHILNFMLAASAVLIGLGGFLLPEHRLTLAAVEFVLALTIILNTGVGVRHEWHRRWLDYRQLAERLRPMRSLKLLGIAAPDPPGSATNPVARRWIEWYAAAVWRAIGCPTGRIEPERAAALAASIATHEVDPQVAYHRAHSRQIMLLDHRLGKISSAIFWITLLASAATIVALLVAPQWLDRWQDWMTLVAAGLPAVGTAVFGIRFQGDFGGSALRSDATAATLGELARELRRDGIGLMRAADLGEQAARAMFADLSEWRLVNQQHDLSISS